MAKKKLNAVQIDPEILLFQNGSADHRLARWSCRITLKDAPDVKPVERLVSSHFAYSEIHWELAATMLSTRQPPPEYIKNYARRILYAYREEYGRSGNLTLKLPSLLDLIHAYASEADADFIERHVPTPQERAEWVGKGEFLFIDLRKATYAHVKRWTEMFDDHEPRVRATIKQVLIKAYDAGEIGFIPPIL